MAWLILLVLLGLPFFLRGFSDHALGRWALFLFWVGCLAGSAACYVGSHRIQKDLETVHLYPLSSEPGNHRVTIAPLSQRSMKAVLVGGLTPLPLSDLKTPNWRFTDKFETATWYSTREYDGPGNGETLLFYVDDWGAPDGPLHLEYDVAEDGRGLLRDRSLAVTHDASAKHLLRDHAQSFVQAFGWALLFWGVLWMTLQVGMERRRRGKTKNASVPAGTEASGSL